METLEKENSDQEQSEHLHFCEEQIWKMTILEINHIKRTISEKESYEKETIMNREIFKITTPKR